MLLLHTYESHAVISSEIWIEHFSVAYADISWFCSVCLLACQYQNMSTKHTFGVFVRPHVQISVIVDKLFSVHPTIIQAIIYGVDITTKTSNLAVVLSLRPNMT